MSFDLIEIIGYIGSLLVAISLMMKSIINLRWINLFGALFFSAYGLIVGAYPVLAVNAFISIVDIYYIVLFYKEKDFFEVLKVEAVNNTLLDRFLEFHKSEIGQIFPEHNLKSNSEPVIFFVLRNLLPVGLFIGEKKSDDTIEIKLDYVIPGYRDFKTAQYLYHINRKMFTSQGIKHLIVHSTISNHINFLNKVGFKPSTLRGHDWYELNF